MSIHYKVIMVIFFPLRKKYVIDHLPPPGAPPPPLLSAVHDYAWFFLANFHLWQYDRLTIFYLILKFFIFKMGVYWIKTKEFFTLEYCGTRARPHLTTQFYHTNRLKDRFAERNFLKLFQGQFIVIKKNDFPQKNLSIPIQQ